MDWTKVCDITSDGQKLVSDLINRVFWFDLTKVYYYDEGPGICGVLADLSIYITGTSGQTPNPLGTGWGIQDIAYHDGSIYAVIRDEYGSRDKETAKVIKINPYFGAAELVADTYQGIGMVGGKKVQRTATGSPSDNYARAGMAKLTSWNGCLWLAIHCANFNTPNAAAWEPNTWMVYVNCGSGFAESLQFFRNIDGINPVQVWSPYFCMQTNELYVKYHYHGQCALLYSRIDGAWAKRTDALFGTPTYDRFLRIQCAHLGEIHTGDPASGAILMKTPDYGANWVNIFPGGYGDHARITGYPDGLTALGALVGGDDKIWFYVAALDYHNLTDNIRPHNFAHTAHSQFFIDNQNGHVWTRKESAGPAVLFPPMHCLDIDVSDRHLYIAGQDVLSSSPLVVQVPCDGIPDTAYGLMIGTSGWTGCEAAGFYECYGHGRYGRNAQVVLASGVDSPLAAIDVLSDGLPNYSTITAFAHRGHLNALYAYGTTFTTPSLYTNTNTRVNNWVHSSNLPWTARSLHWLLDLEMNSRLIIGCSGIQASPVYYNVLGSGWIASTGLPTTVITDIDSFD